jgi:hypothetical protein
MPEIPATMPDPKDRRLPGKPRSEAGATLRSLQELKNERKPPLQGWVSWIPVAAGVALAFVAPQLRDFVAAYEPWGMRAVFPFVLVAGLHEIGLSDELSRTLPQLMLYLQFPLEGLLTRFTLRRGAAARAAFGQLIFLHTVCVIVLWIVAQGQAK